MAQPGVDLTCPSKCPDSPDACATRQYDKDKQPRPKGAMMALGGGDEGPTYPGRRARAGAVRGRRRRRGTHGYPRYVALDTKPRHGKPRHPAGTIVASEEWDLERGFLVGRRAGRMRMAVSVQCGINHQSSTRRQEKRRRRPPSKGTYLSH